MTERQLMGVLMAAFGGVLAGGALLQWRWLVEGRKYRRLAEGLGPLTARLVYGGVGLTLLIFGVLNAAGAWRGGLDGRG